MTFERVLEFLAAAYEGFYLGLSESILDDMPVWLHHSAAILNVILSIVWFVIALILGWNAGGVGGLIVGTIGGLLIVILSSIIVNYLVFLISIAFVLGVWAGIIFVTVSILGAVWSFLWGLGIGK